THGSAARTRPVVAHVAFHHLIDIAVVFRHTKGTREHAIGASDAARLQGALDNAVMGLLDRIGWADSRADRILTVHAHLRRSLHAVAALDCFEVDQRSPAVCIALSARVHAGLAPDAA